MKRKYLIILLLVCLCLSVVMAATSPMFILSGNVIFWGALGAGAFSGILSLAGLIYTLARISKDK